MYCNDRSTIEHPSQTIIVVFLVLSLMFICPAAAMANLEADDTTIIDQTIHNDLYISRGNIITGTGAVRCDLIFSKDASIGGHMLRE